MVKRIEDVVDDKDINAVIDKAHELLRKDCIAMYGDAGPPGRLYDQFEVLRWVMYAIMYDIEYNLNMYYDAVLISNMLINSNVIPDICGDQIAIARFYLQRACYDIAINSTDEWTNLPVSKYYKKFMMR